MDSTSLIAKYKNQIRELGPNDVYKQSYNSEPVLIYLRGKHQLNNNTLKGNIILFSDEELIIDKNTILNDVILISPIIRIKSGFKGNAQFLTNDSLIVEESVELYYPSILFQYQSEEKEGKILIKKNTNLNACLIAMDNTKEDKNSKVEIQEQVKLKGLIWVEGYLQFNAELSGYMFVHKFIWNTTASTYENHLFNATINSTEMVNTYLLPSIFPSKRVGLLKKAE